MGEETVTSTQEPAGVLPTHSCQIAPVLETSLVSHVISFAMPTQPATGLGRAMLQEIASTRQSAILIFTVLHAIFIVTQPPHALEMEIVIKMESVHAKRNSLDLLAAHVLRTTIPLTVPPFVMLLQRAREGDRVKPRAVVRAPRTSLDLNAVRAQRILQGPHATNARETTLDSPAIRVLEISLGQIATNAKEISRDHPALSVRNVLQALLAASALETSPDQLVLSVQETLRVRNALHARGTLQELHALNAPPNSLDQAARNALETMQDLLAARAKAISQDPSALRAQRTSLEPRAINVAPTNLDQTAQLIVNHTLHAAEKEVATT